MSVVSEPYNSAFEATGKVLVHIVTTTQHPSWMNPHRLRERIADEFLFRLWEKLLPSIKLEEFSKHVRIVVAIWFLVLVDLEQIACDTQCEQALFENIRGAMGRVNGVPVMPSDALDVIDALLKNPKIWI